MDSDLVKKLTTIGVIALSAADFPLDRLKNAIRSARTLIAYKAPVSIITIKTGKRRVDRSEVTEGTR